VRVEERLEELGLDLTEPAGENSKIAPAVQTGHLIFTSLFYSEEKGKFGKDILAAQGYQIAQTVAVQCLGALKVLLNDMDRIERIVQVRVYLNCEPTFTDQVQVFHGATELLLDVFGEKTGWHTRSAVGVAQLHDNAALALEMIVQTSDPG